MFETTLTVRHKDHVEHIVLEGDGVVIGRHGECDVVLDDPSVSRHHARLYRDPFGRWIVEDLDSRNGVWVADQQVTAQAVAMGERVTVGHFTLTIEDQHTRQMPVEDNFAAQATLVDDAFSGAELFSKAQRDEVLSVGHLRKLNELADHLIGLPGAEELYPAVCQSLAADPEAVCLVLRVPAAGHALTDPEAIAFCSSGHTPDELPHNLALHVSRRVLEGVRTDSTAVMAGAARDDGQRMDLTIMDDRKPRAVLCAPIGPTGEKLEVLYLDVPADRASESLLDYVQAAARQVSFARKGLLLSEARAERASLDRQLEFARQIQQRLTPPRHIQANGVEVAILYQPAMWVGGDYCDVVRLHDGKLAWAIGDVSGKGLPAALVMATLHGALRTALRFCDDLALAITRLNEHLVSHTPENMFVTMIAGLLDPATGELEFVNAGHPMPLQLTAADGAAIPLGVPTNPPIGILEHDYTADHHVLPNGATLLAVTDGITESANPAGEMFDEDCLQAFAATRTADAAQPLVQAVADTAEEFRKPLGPQDDITVIAVSRS